MKTTYLIDHNSKGLSLRNFIKKKMQKLSSRDIEALLSKNGCKVNASIERFGSTKLSLNDKVEIFPQFFSRKKIEEIPILFEDDHLLIINKPEGITSSVKELTQYLKKELFLVHRLDKLTSGVLVLAKTKEAQEKMEALFFNREVEKKYIAISCSRMSSKRGEINQPLKLKKRYEGGVLYQTTKHGKEAITQWEKAFSSKNETLFILYPITGRTHQIRVHLQSIGHPILGDPVYRGEKSASLHVSRLMLHSRKLCFIHPFSHKRIEIIAPIPIIIRQCISKLFKNQSKCAY